MIVKFCGEVKQKIMVGEYELIIRNNTDAMILDISNEKEIEIKSEPFFIDDCACIGYTSRVDINANGVSCDNSLINIVRYSNDYYKIKINKLKIQEKYSKNIIQTSNIMGWELCLSGQFSQSVSLSKNNKYYEILLEKTIKNAVFSENNGNILLSGNTKEQEYCLVLSGDGGKLLEVSGDKIEVADGNISVLEKFNDIAQQGYVCIYSLDKNGVNLKKNYTVYLEDTIKKPASEYAVPWAYVEALNVGNIKLAREYLSAELNEMLSDDNMVRFFDNFTEMESNWMGDNQKIIWAVDEVNKLARGYEFEIVDNKITNIECLS